MVKAIIFDLDGTLLDTSEDIHCILNGCLKKHGIPEISYRKTLEYVGNGAKKLIERACGNFSDKIDSVYKDFSADYVSASNDRTKLYEGEAEVIEKLKAKGVRMAVLSNKPQSALDKVYDKFLSAYGFDIVVGQTEKFPLKPDPGSALHILKKLKAEKGENVFVGDGETDVVTAFNAGIKCISCLWGYRSEAELRGAGAKIFANNFKQLYSILENENF